MKKILVTYFSESGSTLRAAETIASRLGERNEVEVDICSCEECGALDDYSLIVIGSPNWYGGPATVVKDFLKTNGTVLDKVKTAFYFTCMGLTVDEGESYGGIEIFHDPQLKAPVKPLNQMTLWEKSHAISYYLKNIEKILPGFTAVSVAFFKGNLLFSRLSLGHRLLMRLITWINKDVKAGEYLDDAAISQWAEMLKV